MARLLVVVLAGWVALPTTLFAADEKTPAPAVRFDVGRSFGWRDVTPADFGKVHPNSKVIEVPLRISAGFLTDEKSIEAIIYEIRIPQPLQIQDYLPNTELKPAIEKMVVRQTVDAKKALTITSDKNAKIGYTIPGIFEAGAAASSTQASNESNQVISGVEMDVLPPMQAIVAAFTLDRRQTLCFKLRPFSRTTLEGEKEFALLLVAPKDWSGGLIKIDCKAWLSGYQGVASHKDMVVAVFKNGDDAARIKFEGLAETEQAAKPAVVEQKNVSSEGKERGADSEPLNTRICAGSYSVDNRSMVIDLKDDGKWDGKEVTADFFGGKRYYRHIRGIWFVRNNHLKITMAERQSGLDGEGKWDPIGEVIIDDQILEFSKKDHVFRTKKGFGLTFLKSD
jgi:hypothetical protein